MFKLVVFFLFVYSTLSLELDETPTGESAVEQELVQFEDDKESGISTEEDEEVMEYEMTGGSSEGTIKWVLSDTAKIRARRYTYRCGRRLYNPRFYMCCNGRVVSRSGLSPACCGTRGYDARFRMCCGGNIVTRSGLSPACCGRRGYDARFRMCCGGNIISRSGLSPACCGTRGYDARFRMCCAGNIVTRSGLSPACCGRRGYDARFYKCCSGQVRSRC